jgi:hypothetical protein
MVLVLRLADADDHVVIEAEDEPHQAIGREIFRRPRRIAEPLGRSMPSSRKKTIRVRFAGGPGPLPRNQAHVDGQ